MIARQGLLGAILAMLIAAIVQLAASVMILVAAMRKHANSAAEGIELASRHIGLNPFHVNEKGTTGD